MSAITNQIEEDSGECGSRVRKNLQRSSDAGPSKGETSVSVPVETPKKKRSRASRYVRGEN